MVGRHGGSKPAPRSRAVIRPDDLDGSFYRPTLITGAAQDSEIVQEEVSVQFWSRFHSTMTKRALRLANDTPYGLAAPA